MRGDNPSLQSMTDFPADLHVFLLHWPGFPTLFVRAFQPILSGLSNPHSEITPGGTLLVLCDLHLGWRSADLGFGLGVLATQHPKEKMFTSILASFASVFATVALGTLSSADCLPSVAVRSRIMGVIRKHKS